MTAEDTSPVSAIEVLAPGPLATIQDLGRPGYAAAGVGRSGAADRASHRLANRLVGNLEAAATIEATLGGLRLRADRDLLVALSGAPAGFTIDGLRYGGNAPVWWPAGSTLALDLPPVGLRSYLAVRGGLAVPPVLGSRSTDVLAGLGPAVLQSGDVLPVGRDCGGAPDVDVAPVPPLADEPVLRVLPGPRLDWFGSDALAVLCGSAYDVSSDCNRVGARLTGPVLGRARGGELPSEPMVPGAVQVPTNGQPVVFLADHPVTGGYPVLAVVRAASMGAAAQLRPGQRVRFSVR